MKTSFNLMCRGDGEAYVRLFLKGCEDPTALHASVTTKEGFPLPVAPYVEPVEGKPGSFALVLAFPLFTSDYVDLEVSTDAAFDTTTSDDLPSGSTKSGGAKSKPFAKRIFRGQLKWNSRFTYRFNGEAAHDIRDIDNRTERQQLHVYPIAYVPFSSGMQIFKGGVSAPLDETNLSVRVIDGCGRPVEAPLTYGGKHVASYGRILSAFTLRLPIDDETYFLVCDGTAPNRPGFFCLDRIAKDRMLNAGGCRRFLTTGDGYDGWIRGHKANLAHDQAVLDAACAGEGPVFSIVVPLFRTPPDYLMEMVDSVEAQTYPRWQLVLVNASPDDAALASVLNGLSSAGDPRIVTIELPENRGISENTNAGVQAATGDFVCFLDHDDVLEPDALERYASAVAADPAIRALYSDEDLLLDGRFVDPHLKSDFNLDLLRTHNYITHFLAVRSDLAKSLPLNGAYDGAQDYDLVLRLAERLAAPAPVLAGASSTTPPMPAATSPALQQGAPFHHVRQVLYHWRAHENSTAANASSKSYADEAGLRALQAHLDRSGLHARARHASMPFHYRVEYAVKGRPLVSILIPNKDNVEVLRRCIDSIRDVSTYESYEIVVIENNSVEEATFAYYRTLERTHAARVVTWEHAFNYSAVNNFGARHANGDYLLLLNNDTQVISPDWIESMLSLCQRPDVGVVGARLLYPDDTVQHVGVALLRCDEAQFTGGAVHVQPNLDRNDPGYFWRTNKRQDLSAVTAACLMTKRALYEQLGGLDEDFVVAYNDVDFCLRARQAGYLVVFDPEAMLYHYESLSRGPDDTSSSPANYARFLREQGLLRSRWAEYYALGDPYWPPLLLG